MLNFDLNLFFTLGAVSTVSLLGIVVYFHDHKSLINIIFLVQTLVISIWSVINYLSLITSGDDALFWIRLVIALAVPHIFLYLLFVMNFPHRNLIIKKRELFFIIGLMLVMVVLAVTKHSFDHITIINGQLTPVPGKAMPAFAIVLVVTSLISAGLVIKKYKNSENLIKKQWLFIGGGLMLTYLLLISLVFVMVVAFNNPLFVPYSPVFVLPMFFGAAYAILKHQLFNVKVIATETLTFILIFASLIQLFSAQSLIAIIISIFTVITLVIFGILLIRSVLKEIEHRQQLQRLSSELYKANQKLKELDQLKTEFLSIASHQLRTPLSGIKGYLSMMIDGDFGNFTGEQGGILNRVKAEVDRLVRLVQDFLNVSRIESGQLTINKLDFNLTDVIKTVIQELGPSAQTKNIILDHEIPAGPIKIKADPDKLKDVLVNLTDNAIKYTKKGRVWVAAKLVEPKWVQVEVHDSGVGINEQEIDKLFQKFQRARGIARISPSGTGLGLYTAKKIISAHGGKIWAESPGVDQGSIFAFKLPVG